MSSEADGSCRVLGKMQKTISKYIGVLLLGVAIWSCSETKEVDPSSLGTTYFPLEVGTYRIYRVEGVRHTSHLDSTIFSYWLKESISDTFTNLEEGTSYAVVREKRDSETEAWQFDSLWTARIDERTIVMVENNVPIVKLAFPTTDSLTWDSNRLNDKSKNEYTLIDVEEPYTQQFGDFNNTITVLQEFFPDLVVNYIAQKEVYGKDIGLVFKEDIVLKYRTEDQFINREILSSGFQYRQYLVEYGQE